jgi:hypothetical protein
MKTSPKTLLGQVRDAIQVRYYSYRTEASDRAVCLA